MLNLEVFYHPDYTINKINNKRSKTRLFCNGWVTGGWVELSLHPPRFSRNYYSGMFLTTPTKADCLVLQAIRLCHKNP